MPALPTPSRNHSHSHTPTQRAAPKPDLNMSSDDPSTWLNFSLPPRSRAGIPGSGVPGIPRRSRRGEGWRGGPMSREKFLNASFKFVLKPTETLSYGAHFADPDISLHWPHILQVLVPTFSAFSVAQGYVLTDKSEMEEERRGRMCPICLGKPVAGRMTKCGHIFCFPCILHYIQLSDIPKSAKCPICGDTVHSSYLKSVKYLDAAAMLKASAGEDDDDEIPDPNSASASGSSHIHAQSISHEHDHEHGIIGVMDGFEETLEEAKAVDSHHAKDDKRHQIHMRLVQRPQMTTLALPSSSTWPSDAIPPHTAPWYFLPDILAYSRFMLSTPEYMLSELQRELNELKGEWDMLKGDELGREFVKVAKEKVERQMQKVKVELVSEIVRRSERDARESWGEAVGGSRREKERKRERDRIAKQREEQARLAAEETQDKADIPTEFLASSSAPSFDNSANIKIPPNLDVEPNPMPASTPKKSRRRGGGGHGANPPPAIPPSQSYYFYQSSLGANVFLHPLDIRILLAHYKSYSLFPQTISFTTTGYDPGTINDELRKKCKYLGHLPVGTEVVFVEADLEPIVDKEVLAQFEQPLKARRNKRKERIKKEDRAKVKWEKSEREKMPIDLRTTPSAFRSGSANEDRDFAMTLARSAIEFDTGSSTFQPGSASSSNSHLQALSPYPISANCAQAQGGISASYSPPNGGGLWGQQQPSFAHALHNHTTSSMPIRRRDEIDWEVEAAWEAFENLSVNRRSGSANGNGNENGNAARSEGDSAEQRDGTSIEQSGGTIRESEKGGGGTGGKKGKKGKGQKLVLGGGGARRA
uniref:Alkylbase DNA N-glycosylase n=1 Tax=Kwoniella dejecticola CBS 10117 TaxID=1296121 RepID=A0A1A6ACD6_9TREE|nr:alkylbase DNA N-glycosylase [Kwoniella dejecticola CBS 10117]OBR87719.1 alkylbase DNA N-glycosylase [Kwoniella dejecticola CBS 10117]